MSGRLVMVVLMMTVTAMAMRPVCGPFLSTQPPMMDRLLDMMSHALLHWLQPSAMARVVTRMLEW